MGLLITCGSSLLGIFGALELIGMFFGLGCVIFLLLWKANAVLYDWLVALLKYILIGVCMVFYGLWLLGKAIFFKCRFLAQALFPNCPPRSATPKLP